MGDLPAFRILKTDRSQILPSSFSVSKISSRVGGHKRSRDNLAMTQPSTMLESSQSLVSLPTLPALKLPMKDKSSKMAKK